MINYIKVRLTQPSTWLGVAAGITAFIQGGAVLSIETLSTVFAAAALVHIDERGPK